MKRIANGIALGLALATGVALAGQAAAADVKFGIGGPLTGGSAAFGAQLKNGVEQAVADINAAGGILGQKLTTESSAMTAPTRRKASRSPTSSPATA